MIESDRERAESPSSLTQENGFVKSLLQPSSLMKFLFFLCADVILITASLNLAYLFHFDFSLNIYYPALVMDALPWFLAIKLAFFYIFRIYKITWRYIGLFDMINIVLALFLSASLLMLLSLPVFSFLPTAMLGFSKRVIVADAIISLFLIAALRISKRLYLEVLPKKATDKSSKRTLIVGAGNAGEMILRDMARQGFPDFHPVGFLDDDPVKIGTYLHGVKVLGKTDRLREFITQEEIKAVIIAVPSLEHKKLRQLYEAAKLQKVDTIKVIPRLYNFTKPSIELKALEDISIEDLIGRQVVTIDATGIEAFLNGKTVLITGAGGSIGSEIVMQVCTFQPQRIILFDVDETELHNLGLRLNRRFPGLVDRLAYGTGNVMDDIRLEEVFREYSPQIVFHAAALKHVPMMELNPKEAVKVNMFGTYTIARAARGHGVEKFVMISTDKAVRPTSIMGATKRMAEFICQAMNGNNGYARPSPHLSSPFSGEEKRLGGNPFPTQFISVRFGNVLGSRGSVLPLFLEQLRHGEALTVTHKEMKRYFMTIPEAVSLVLQASVIGRGGNVLVLDMGEPVEITAFAEDLIKLNGLVPYRDIDIRFTGLRPGEKLFEEILTAEEGTDASIHEKIFVARGNAKFTLAEISGILDEFMGLLRDSSLQSQEGVRDLLKKYVKHYHVET